MAKNKVSKKKKLPIAKFQAGNTSATVWTHKAKYKGKSFDSFNVEIVKNYKDDEDEWQKTSNFNKQDLVKVEVVLRQAINFLYLKVEKDKDDDDNDEDEETKEDKKEDKYDDDDDE